MCASLREGHGIVQGCVEERQQPGRREHTDGGGQEAGVEESHCVCNLWHWCSLWQRGWSTSRTRLCLQWTTPSSRKHSFKLWVMPLRGSPMARHLLWTRSRPRSTRLRRPYISRTRPARSHSPTSWERQPCGTGRWRALRGCRILN